MLLATWRYIILWFCPPLLWKQKAEMKHAMSAPSEDAATLSLLCCSTKTSVNCRHFVGRQEGVDATSHYYCATIITMHCWALLHSHNQHQSLELQHIAHANCKYTSLPWYYNWYNNCLIPRIYISIWKTCSYNAPPTASGCLNAPLWSMRYFHSVVVAGLQDTQQSVCVQPQRAGVLVISIENAPWLRHLCLLQNSIIGFTSAAMWKIFLPDSIILECMLCAGIDGLEFESIAVCIRATSASSIYCQPSVSATANSTPSPQWYFALSCNTLSAITIAIDKTACTMTTPNGTTKLPCLVGL